MRRELKAFLTIPGEDEAFTATRGRLLPSSFSLLKQAERDAVAAYVRDAYERVVHEAQLAYISKNAKSDPEAWRLALRELIASDPHRVAALMEREERRQRSSKSGFTLIELSIVLVIIGLIAGGVLVGKDLISAASIRSQITQVEKFNSAANTFFGKYGYLPGDIPALPASQFGFASRGTVPGEGDGDGILECAGDAPGCQHHGYTFGEPAMFWVDLSAARLIDGSFTSATSTGPAPSLTGSLFTQYFPVAKIGYGNSVMVFPSDGSYFALSQAKNYFAIALLTGTDAFGSPIRTVGLTVKQTYDIDKKIDDGLPFSGTVSAFEISFLPNTNAAQPASPTTCWDNNNVANGPVNYSITQNGGSGVNCQLISQLLAGN